MSKTSASVRVTLQVEVTVGTWGSAESFNTLRDIAVREAKQKLNNVLDRKGCRIVGEPVAMHVILQGDMT